MKIISLFTDIIRLITYISIGAIIGYQLGWVIGAPIAVSLNPSLAWSTDDTRGATIVPFSVWQKHKAAKAAKTLADREAMTERIRWAFLFVGAYWGRRLAKDGRTFSEIVDDRRDRFVAKWMSEQREKWMKDNEKTIERLFAEATALGLYGEEQFKYVEDTMDRLYAAVVVKAITPVRHRVVPTGRGANERVTS